MTEQPPYPPDGQPNQPPTGWGQAPPPAGYPQPAGPVAPYASWGSRFGAYLIDGLLSLAAGAVLIVPGIIWMIAGAEETTDSYGYTTSEPAIGGLLLLLLGYAVVYVFAFWNQGWRQGQTGQSLGKKYLKIRVVKVDDGQVLGGGMGLLRYLLLSILGGACILDFLWPLWDARKQTWHDMIVSTVVVEAR